MAEIEKDIHTRQELAQLQALPLDAKITRTKELIREWVDKFGLGKVFVSFSGGKDSTVLLDIARSVYPNMRAVFYDTGLEWPELRKFVLAKDNVVAVRPNMTFKQVIEKYGTPMISKDVAHCIYYLRRNKEDPEKYPAKSCVRKMYGDLSNSPFRINRYEFMVDAPFEIGSSCCNIMKKNPGLTLYRKNGWVPIIGTMADESRNRVQSWLKYGCNSSETHVPRSTPLSFWTEQDVLLYIKNNNLEIAPPTEMSEKHTKTEKGFFIPRGVRGQDVYSVYSARITHRTEIR